MPAPQRAPTPPPTHAAAGIVETWCCPFASPPRCRGRMGSNWAAAHGCARSGPPRK